MRRFWFVFVTVVAWAQEPLRVAPLQFDVASVKAVLPENLGRTQITTGPGRWKAQSISIGGLIAHAYGVQSVQLVDLQSEPVYYDVEGKADGAYSRVELRVMLQGLLAERFRLKFHREMREMAVDRLVIGKELKLRATELTDADPRGYSFRVSQRGLNFRKAKADAMSLEWLADNLSDSLSKVVVDETGLKGVYEFDADVEIDMAEAADRKVPQGVAANHIREAVVAAMGLKLQSGKKEQVGVLVIDHVERPEAN